MALKKVTDRYTLQEKFTDRYTKGTLMLRFTSPFPANCGPLILTLALLAATLT